VDATGRVCFVCIHIRPTVPRDPPPVVYRADREAHSITTIGASVAPVLLGSGTG